MSTFKNYLDKHPKLENLELLVPDMNGIFRGKRIDLHEANHCLIRA